MISLKYQLPAISKQSLSWSNHVEYRPGLTGQPATSCLKTYLEPSAGHVGVYRVVLQLAKYDCKVLTFQTLRLHYLSKMVYYCGILNCTAVTIKQLLVELATKITAVIVFLFNYQPLFSLSNRHNSQRGYRPQKPP